ncbi:MAG: leucine-rich repeat domain-containing protein, partial [Lachnospiraceae bacterium]|nr:leucine-rich repeat domain-containing protein [Lachnospiraceae bacterium]
MKTTWKRIMVLLLSASLFLGSVPMPVIATESNTTEMEEALENLLNQQIGDLGEEAEIEEQVISENMEKDLSGTEDESGQKDTFIEEEVEQEEIISDGEEATEETEEKNPEQLEKEDVTVDIQIQAENTATSGSCGTTATWSLEGGVLTISGSGDIDTFNSSSMWKLSRDITQVIIADGITKIGSNCFAYTGITEITIPESVIEIGASAFGNCENLETVNLPSDLKSLDTFVFGNCSKLNKVNIPKSLTNTSYNIFAGCPLGELTFEEGITKLPDFLFECSLIEHLTIPDTVQIIGSNCFASTGIIEITIPESVIEIGAEAFGGCSNLETVNLPSNLKVLGINAFSYCSKLNKVNIPKSLTNTSYPIFSGCPLGELSFEEGITK